MLCNWNGARLILSLGSFFCTLRNLLLIVKCQGLCIPVCVCVPECVVVFDCEYVHVFVCHCSCLAHLHLQPCVVPGMYVEPSVGHEC